LALAQGLGPALGRQLSAAAFGAPVGALSFPDFSAAHVSRFPCHQSGDRGLRAASIDQGMKEQAFQFPEAVP
jgi:hypothetical protein